MNKFRNFAIVTYLCEAQINEVFLRHTSQVKAAAYILHDNDLNEDKEPKSDHTHIVLCLINATTCNSIKKWFSGFVDDNNLEVNTFVQNCVDVQSSFDYLTHNTEQALADGKYKYSLDCVKGINLEYFKNVENQDVDNLTLAVTDLMNGVPLADCMRKYGRDFIVHYGHIKALYNDIQKQFGGELLG